MVHKIELGKLRNGSNAEVGEQKSGYLKSVTVDPPAREGDFGLRATHAKWD